MCTQEYLKKVIEMKKEGLAAQVETLISMNGGIDAVKEEANSVGLDLLDMSTLIADMEHQKVMLNETQPDDVYIFSYTSGTTGDSKGVKLTHRNILSTTEVVLDKFPPAVDPCTISYLPYPHSFE